MRSSSALGTDSERKNNFSKRTSRFSLSSLRKKLPIVISPPTLKSAPSTPIISRKNSKENNEFTSTTKAIEVALSKPERASLEKQRERPLPQLPHHGALIKDDEISQATTSAHSSQHKSVFRKEPNTHSSALKKEEKKQETKAHLLAKKLYKLLTKDIGKVDQNTNNHYTTDFLACCSQYAFLSKTEEEFFLKEVKHWDVTQETYTQFENIANRLNLTCYVNLSLEKLKPLLENIKACIVENDPTIQMKKPSLK